MNKKGAISALTEGVVLSLLFVIIIGAVLGYMNTQYDKDFSVGLDTSALEEQFAPQIQTAYEETGGEVETTNEGLSLISMWSIFYGLLKVLWGFVSGSWISTIVVDMLKIEGTAGIMTALTLRILFSISLIWGVIKLFSKTNP